MYGPYVLIFDSFESDCHMNLDHGTFVRNNENSGEVNKFKGEKHLAEGETSAKNLRGLEIQGHFAVTT